jgi:hypothetical protein
MGDAEEYRSSYGLLLVPLDQKHGCKHAICTSFQDPFPWCSLIKGGETGGGGDILFFSSPLSLLLVILWHRGKEYSLGTY